MTATCVAFASVPWAALGDQSPPDYLWILYVLAVPLGLLLLAELCGMRYIPHTCVGVVEKLWSSQGSVEEGKIMALKGEAGYQADLLRGGVHFGLWRWQYRIHKVPLVMIPQGKIGYVYARDGEPLPPGQTLGRTVDCNHFQDARCFLGVTEATADSPATTGQRGRQRTILREGVYAINLALFVVLTEDVSYHLNLYGSAEMQKLASWQEELIDIKAFDPVVIGGALDTPDPLHPENTIKVDSIGVVTVHDGPSLPPGQIIAPEVGTQRNDANYHNNFQDIEAFLRAGGSRGRQYAVLTDGTYFINRWFATIDLQPKTVVPIGYVGVVVSYYGRSGQDLSGLEFRHGERVARGERGVWEQPLGPDKYAFNPFAGKIILVPTTNFVLHWVTGKTESHRYDESLKSIDLVTRDAYEPSLPLSVVVHIDYQKAPGVIQRFGDVKKLITQTLDPMLSAYFRDVAHKKTMLGLLHERDAIQEEATKELRRKFQAFDIECVDVLIGKPDTEQASGKIEVLLEQLRQRQLSMEQIQTYEHQKAAAVKQQELNEAQARVAMQTQLTSSHMQVQIVQNQAEAELSKARKQAEQTIVTAQADNERRILQAEADLIRSRKQAEQTVVLAEAEAKQKQLAGRGEASRIMQTGLSEASVQLRKISSFGDPRLFALSLVAEHLSRSSQPLVPERVFMAGANGENGHGTNPGQGMFGTLLSLLVAEKSGFQVPESPELAGLREYADRMTKEVLQTVQVTMPSPEAAATLAAPKS